MLGRRGWFKGGDLTRRMKSHEKKIKVFLSMLIKGSFEENRQGSNPASLHEWLKHDQLMMVGPPGYSLSWPMVIIKSRDVTRCAAASWHESRDT